MGQFHFGDFAHFNIGGNNLNDRSADWLITDIGIGQSRRSCGVWHSPNNLLLRYIHELIALARDMVTDGETNPLNIAIEAPLSGAFHADGRLRARPCDKYPADRNIVVPAKAWYHGAAPSTTLAAQLLLAEIYRAEGRTREVRLFEGHVAFKDRIDYAPAGPQRNSHLRDTLVLKDAIDNQERRDSFTLPEHQNGRFDFRSLIPFFDHALIPLVIRPQLT